MMRDAMTLEVCVEDLDGIDAAVEGGADRIELCAALAVGGLTPPASLIRAAAQAPLPAHLLVRPREGGFAYTPREIALIADDIVTAAHAGLAGIVIGATLADHRLDAPTLAMLIAHARTLGSERGRPLSLTLHRAFDVCSDLGTALDTAIELGFDRVLTSGGTPRAIDGVEAVADLHRQAAGRIIILAGSGVSPQSLPALLRTGITEVHASCRQPIAGGADPVDVRFGFAAPNRTATSTDRIRQLSHMLTQKHTLE